ncbi:MAG: hypothetical protein NTW21_03585 [Verrucomicrobia bacterium]|nr:hypothetical protein [Verrucomicrobiota bacterium]
MTHQTTPQIDAFRSIVNQAGTLHAELSTLHTAIRDLDSIKARMGDCRDEAEARKSLGELTRAEEAVAVKRIREPRLRADISGLLSGSVEICIAAFTEAKDLVTGATDAAVAGLADTLRSVQPEPEDSKTDRATTLAVQACRTRTMAVAQHDALDAAWPGSWLQSEALEKQVGAAKSAIAALDATLAALPQIEAEAKRMGAACDAFRKVLTNR